jgi:hypothetical protein
MKFSSFSGSELQSVENGIGRGPLSLLRNPLLYERQARGGLMDVVAFRDIRNRIEQLLDASFPRGCQWGNQRSHSASRQTNDRARLIDFVHWIAFPPSIATLIR